jgi:hypothetical protein
VGVAISGGGIRAANFGLAALYELERLRVLDFVSVISSVSGGSLAAAYYALYGSKSIELLNFHELSDAGVEPPLYLERPIDPQARQAFWTQARDHLRQDF